MRVLVAPDKFKGSLSAAEVADSIAIGLRAGGASAITLPLADGGDGSVAAGVAAGMPSRTCTVPNALGELHTTTIAYDGVTAIVEIANTVGLQTLPPSVLAPMTASSFGFGQAIRYAVGLKPQRIVLALGGSASTDGGTGMLAALGYRFYGPDESELTPGGHNLHDIYSVNAEDAVNLDGIEIVVAGDVTNPLLGPTGTAAIFGPQKGASKRDIDVLDAGLGSLVETTKRSLGGAVGGLASTAGAGAAGGCGFACLLIGAQMRSGAEYFLDLLEFDAHLRESDLVVTGEGRIDTQTLSGKLPAVVLRRSAPKPVIAVVGRNELGYHHGTFDSIYEVADYVSTDTSEDASLTAQILTRIGQAIGEEASIRQSG
jgi:glycerate kinase